MRWLVEGRIVRQLLTYFDFCGVQCTKQLVLDRYHSMLNESHIYGSDLPFQPSLVGLAGAKRLGDDCIQLKTLNLRSICELSSAPSGFHAVVGVLSRIRSRFMLSSITTQ